MLLIGIIWILQGVNILPGSFMTGHIIWAIYGALLGRWWARGWSTRLNRGRA